MNLLELAYLIYSSLFFTYILDSHVSEVRDLICSFDCDLFAIFRYFYATMVRDPIHRFLSEFRHVLRGATWKASRHMCNGRLATADVIIINY